MIELGERLGVRLVAEGVERSEQAAALDALDCPMAQGFYFARPLAARDVYPLLDERRRELASR